MGAEGGKAKTGHKSHSSSVGSFCLTVSGEKKNINLGGKRKAKKDTVCSLLAGGRKFIIKKNNSFFIFGFLVILVHTHTEITNEHDRTKTLACEKFINSLGCSGKNLRFFGCL